MTKEKHSCQHDDFEDLGKGYWVDDEIFFHDPASMTSNLHHLRCRKCGKDFYREEANAKE